MDTHQYDQILRDAAARTAVAAAGALDRPVPSCPEWTVADLLSHLSVVLSFWGAIAAGGEEPPTDWTPPQRPDDADVIAWYRAEVADGAAAVAAVDPAAPRWSWSHQHDGAFIQRRMAQEFTVHAWDADLAIGAEADIEPAIAVDGVDEFLDIFLAAKPECLAGDPLTIHVHTTDADGEWILTIGDGQHHLERTHGKGEVAVRASASDLLLWLWGRREADGDGFAVFGDEAVLADFVGRVHQF
jgi:uncharacterized protein (TIGR03083 family)